MSGITNIDVGQIFGVDHTTVSRWRSGSRLPLLVHQAAIRKALRWSLDDQGDAMLLGPDTWAAEFEKKLSENYAELMGEQNG